MQPPRNATIPSLVLCLFAGCSGSDRNTQPTVSLQDIGDVAADPSRECAFVSDAQEGIVYEIDLCTGDVLRQYDFDNPVEGLTTDPCGDTLYVCQTRFPVITLLDLERFTIRDHLALPAHPRQVETNGDYVFTTTRLGLVAMRMFNRRIQVIAEDLDPGALLALSRDGEYLFTAECLEQSVRVRRFRARTMEGFDQEQLLPPVTPVHLQVSHDCEHLFLGCQETGELMVLRTRDLSMHQCVDLGPQVRSMAINAISTRAYSVGAGLTIQERNTWNYRHGHQTAMAASVSGAESLFLAGDGQSLLTHHGGLPLREGIFDVELTSPPTAFMGREWSVRVSGTPGTSAVLYYSIKPGFTFLDPPKETNARFLDLDPGLLRVLGVIHLDQKGEWSRTLLVPGGAPPVEEVILQAVAMEHGSIQVTNARPVRLLDPADCGR